MDNKESKGKGFWLIIGGIILIVTFVLIFVGWGSISKFVWVIFEIIAFLGLMALIFYGVYYFFFKEHKYDVNYVNYKRIVKSATLAKYPLLKDFYLSGDKGHSRVKIGKIKGYTRMPTLARIYEWEEVIDPETGKKIQKIITRINEKGEDEPIYTLETLEMDCFVVGNTGIMSHFEEPKVIRIHKDDHDDLIADVTAFCYSLIPISNFWYANTDILDDRKIKQTIMRDAEQTTGYVILSQLRQHIDIATGIDPQHKKLIERRQLVELPEFKPSQNKDPYN